LSFRRNDSTGDANNVKRITFTLDPNPLGPIVVNGGGRDAV
jgi:hypothetical protein